MTKAEVEAHLAKAAVDCGDNSCRFAIKKGGMRTNGGCRCVENLGSGQRSMIKWTPIEKLAVMQADVIRQLLKQIDELKDKS